MTMADKFDTFFSTDKDKVIFRGNYMEVYIPKYYFDSKVSSFMGQRIETFGVFNFKIFSSEEKKEVVPVHTFKFPSGIVTTPSNIEYGDLILIPGTPKVSYAILKYFKNDVFIDNIWVAKKPPNINLFINLLHGGKLPTTLSYKDILKMEMDAQTVNGASLDVPSTVMELIISEIYRDKNNPSKPFRFKAGSSATASMVDYKMVNLKSIANFNSTFTALTFEDIDFAITASVNKTREDRPEAVSPIEKTIKY